MQKLNVTKYTNTTKYKYIVNKYLKTNFHFENK